MVKTLVDPAGKSLVTAVHDAKETEKSSLIKAVLQALLRKLPGPCQGACCRSDCCLLQMVPRYQQPVDMHCASSCLTLRTRWPSRRSPDTSEISCGEACSLALVPRLASRGLLALGSWGRC